MCLLNSYFNGAYLVYARPCVQCPGPEVEGMRWVWWNVIIISVGRLRQKDQILGRPGLQNKTLFQNNRKGWGKPLSNRIFI